MLFIKYAPMIDDR